MIGFILSICTFLGAVLLGTICMFVVSACWKGWNNRTTAGSSLGAAATDAYVDPRRHAKLVSFLLARRKVGALRLSPFEDGATFQTCYNWVVIERPLVKADLVDFLESVDPENEGMRDFVVLEYVQHPITPIVRMNFAFQRTSDAMLFKLAHGGAA